MTNEPELPLDDQPELPLAPPERPVIFSDLALRISHVPPKGAGIAILALEQTIEGSKLSEVAAQVHPGHVEIALTSGFGSAKTLSLTGPEAVFVYSALERFLQELPR